MRGIGARFVYVLRSESDPSHHYVGRTKDVDERLRWHNEGPCGFRLPDATTLGPVHLQVSDLTRSLEYYQRVIDRALGFDKTVWSYPGASFLSAGGYHHHLGTNTWAPGPAPAADQARLLEWTKIVPSAIEARAVGERLWNTAAPAIEEDADLVVTDPWGTRLRISPER